MSERLQGVLEHYDLWIWDTYGDSTGYGRCAERTLAMQQVFPLLQRVKGIYHCPVWGERTHWWLLTPEGVIVDPTAKQFPSQGQGRYQELSDDELPTGICMDCAKLVYNNTEFCNDECRQRTAAYLAEENKHSFQIPHHHLSSRVS